MVQEPESTQVQFIPQLQLYFDPVRQVYFAPSELNSAQTPRRRQSDGETLENMKLNVNAIIKIVAFVAAIVLQYSVLVNKIDDNADKLQLAKTNAEQQEKRIKDLETTINKVESQSTITSELVNQLQIRIANDRKK